MSTGPSRFLVICSVARSGSSLLCRQLANAGIGIPHEYFGSFHRAALGRQWKIDAADDTTYLNALFHRRTTPNGIFAVKLHWNQFVQASSVIEETIFAASPVVIFLSRQDLAAQSWSLHEAYLTGVWDDCKKQSSTHLHGPEFGDLDRLKDCFRQLCQDQRVWQAYLAKLDAPYLQLRYEDYVTDQRNWARRIMALLDVEAPVPPPEPSVTRAPNPVRDAAILRLRKFIAGDADARALSDYPRTSC